MRTMASSYALWACVFKCVHACIDIHMHLGHHKEKRNKKILLEAGSGIRN